MDMKRENVVVDVMVMDPETQNDIEARGPESRSIILWSPAIVAGTLTLMCSAIGLGLRSLAVESAVDGTYIRWALLVMIPIIFFMGLVSHLLSY
jgi:hypothetical protein